MPLPDLDLPDPDRAGPHGAIATLTLRTPDAANRLGPEDLDRLADHIATVNARDGVRVLLLRAEGRHFCAGFDIGRFEAGTPAHFARVVDALETARPVTIAVLQGGVYGGGTDLALACDFRVGANTIEMFMPAAKLGLHYYASGLERYVARLGVDATKRLFLAGERLEAAEMKALGYLTHLCASDSLQATAADLSQRCAAMAPLALIGMKQHLNAIARGRLDPAALTADLQRTLASDDLREGIAAWAERRPPRFSGR